MKIYIKLFFLFFSLITIPLLEAKEYNITIKNLRIVPKIRRTRPGWVTIGGTIVTGQNWESNNIKLKASFYRYDSHHGNHIKEMFIPTNSRKHFLLYVYIKTDGPSFTIQILLENDVIFQKSLGSSSAYGEYLNIGYFPPTKEHSLFFLKNIRNYSPWMYSYIRSYYYKSGSTTSLADINIFTMSKYDFPDRWFGYQQLDIIVLSKLVRFSRLQEDALIKWISSGGILILAPQNKQVLSAKIFSRLLKVKLDESNIKIAKTPIYLKSYNTSKSYRIKQKECIEFYHPNAHYLYKKKTHWSWYTHYGAGSIIYSGFDLGSYKNASAQFWRSFILPQIYACYKHKYSILPLRDNYREEKEQNISNALDVARERLPGIWAIILSLIIYLVCIGPMNFVYFRKKGLTINLLWSIPILSFLFVAIIIGYGYWSRGLHTEVYSFNITKIVPNAEHTLQTKFMGIFSGSRNIYDIKVDKDSSIIPIFPNRDAKRNARIQYVHRDYTIIDKYPLNLWQMGYFQIERHMKKAINITAKKHKKGIILTKPKGITLKGVLYIEGYKLYFLDNIPGHVVKKTLGIPKTSISLPRSGRYYYDWRYRLENVLRSWGFSKEKHRKAYKLFTRELFRDTRKIKKTRLVALALSSQLNFPISISPKPKSFNEKNFICIYLTKGVNK